MIRLIYRFIAGAMYFMFTFSSGILLGLIRPFHVNNMYWTGRIFSWKSEQILGIKIIHRGVEFIPKSGPVIFMSNHHDNFDIILGGSCLRPRTVLIGKKQLIWIPFFGLFYWLTGSFLLDRKNKARAKKSMQKVSQRVREEKVNIWILPEGTRSKGRGLLPFKRGGFITAIHCQTPIVPVVWSTYSKTLDFKKKDAGVIISSTLPAVSTEGLTLDDLDKLMDKVHAMMKAELERIDQEVYEA